ncbi:MAG: bile acid:sodium symporter family protein [Verrucomicrobiota bacterium]
MKQLLTANSFVVGIAVAILLAALAPEFGSESGILPVPLLKAVGIFFIFFLQGVLLPLGELKKGLTDWKLHLCVQTTTFLFFPVVVSAALAAFSSQFAQPDLRLGFLYLSFLPTTIASAIALTTTSNGNVSGALFNTTLSNVGGIFLVPFLCLGFLGLSGTFQQIEVGPILIGILLKIILPLLLGQGCRWFLKGWAERHKVGIRRFNNTVILFIVYAAFCQSFTEDVWTTIEGPVLLLTFIGALVLLAVASFYVWFLSGLIRLDPPTRVAAFFCGSQKTLAVGLPLSVMIFGQDGLHADLSLLMVPLLVYHPAQLVLGGWLSPRLAKYAEKSVG